MSLSNDAALPVNATYLTEAPGTGNFSAPVNLFNINLSYMVAAFLALSAFFHFLMSSKAMFPKYSAGLRNNINVFRWVEYSISSSLMIIVILQLNGTADYIALLGIFGVNVLMILFGWVHCRQHSVDCNSYQHRSPKGSTRVNRARFCLRHRHLTVRTLQLFCNHAVQAAQRQRQRQVFAGTLAS